jgi:uncharacterized repeat protein (TIGR03847 family)
VRAYPEVDFWLAGAIGRPGERTFLIQFGASDGVHSYVLEKGQVAALVVEGRRLLEVIGTPTPPQGAAPVLSDIVMPEFRIAEIQLAYDEAIERISIRLVPTTDDVAGVEFTVTVGEFAPALDVAERALEGGRPPCPRCGLAMDPDGHHCPATNGDLRGHRP